MKDFIHKSLLNAGSKDAVSNMLQGAALGAGANTALGAVQGDFDIVGNATAGALLGAGGGAAMRHMGDKYSSAIANMRKQGMEGSDSFSINHFTHAIKEEADFMGNPEMMKRAQGMAGMPSAKGATANAPTGGSVNTGSRKDGGVNRPGAEGHRDQPIAPTHVEIPSMPSFDRMGMPMSSGTAKIPVVPNTDSVGEAIGRSGHRKGGGFTPMSAEQVMAQESRGVGQAARDIGRNMTNQAQDYVDGWNALGREAKISQQKSAGQSKRDARAANRDTGDSLVGDSNSYKELLKESQEKKASAQSLADEIKAGGYVPDNKGGWKLPSDPVTSAQSAAGDIIAGVFRETGRGSIKKPTSFEGGTLRLPKKPIDSSNFKPSYRNGEYVHPQHNKVKKYQPEK